MTRNTLFVVEHLTGLTLWNRAHYLVFVYIKQMNSVFSCVCPVIDHEFRHNIEKVAVDPHPTSALTML